jgi:flavin reductase (DIM6/NTAB) family NADH-FMN oxidoreductase RutF
MRKNFGIKPYLMPQPVLIVAAYDKDGNVNAMNAAWGGVFDSHQIALCLSANHKTVKNILYSSAFSISIGTAPYVASCDYVGIVSGNEVKNKVMKAGFSTTHSGFVDAPIINELPLTLECKLISYNSENGHLIGEIVNVSAEEYILTDGKIDYEKLQPICYEPISHYYLRLGAKAGEAFEEGEKLK